jgi:thioredoxin 1
MDQKQPVTSPFDHKWRVKLMKLFLSRCGGGRMPKAKYLCCCILLWLMPVLICSCSGENRQAAQKEENAVSLEKEKVLVTKETTKTKIPAITVKTENKDLPMVTFVELGSVNCIPCKQMQPIMKEIEEEYKTKVKVIFYDVWKPEGQPFGEKYKIRVIPTQVFLDKDGQEFYRHEGYFPKKEIEALLTKQGINK